MNLVDSRNEIVFLSAYEENQVAFEKDLSEEIELYGPVAIVNLVERTGKEAVVGDEYADHVCSFNNEKIIYITFDLHYYWLVFEISSYLYYLHSSSFDVFIFAVAG